MKDCFVIGFSQGGIMSFELGQSLSKKLGGIVSFWFYNKYPARIFEGNTGPLVFGACIGTLIVIKDLFIFGIFILLPHIADFLFFIYLKLSGRPFIKFGELRA